GGARTLGGALTRGGGRTPGGGPAAAVPDAGGGDALVVAARAAESYRGDTERAVADLTRWLHDGWRVAVLFDGHGPAQRAAQVLRRADVAAALLPTLDRDLPPRVA